MMIGSSRVRGCPRHRLASDRPDSPGSIQSSTTRSGRTRSTSACAWSTEPAMVTSYPAWRRLMQISSAIADSSSITRMRLMVSLLSADHCLDGRDGIVADVHALDHVDDHLGQVLGVVAHPLDGL